MLEVERSSFIFTAEEKLPDIQRIYDEVCADKVRLAGLCKKVSDLVADLGFELVIGGKFRLDFPIYRKNLLEPHTFSVDREGKIIDLTATQFNPGLRTPIERGVLIAVPGDGIFERYSNPFAVKKPPLFKKA